jgi:CSLREA domain-containing protein
MRRTLSAISAAGLLAVAATPAHAAAPAVSIAAPARASVGDAFTVTMHLSGVVRLRGYEAALAAPRGAAALLGASPTAAGMTAMPSVDSGTALWFGAYGRAATSRAGTVARVVVRPAKAGTLVLRLAAPVVVNDAGARVAPRIAKATVRVRVGRGPTRVAPLLRASTRRARAGRVIDADLNHDGRVTRIDVVEAIAQRESARLANDVCGVRGLDVNRDGCADVADVVGVARRVGAVAGDGGPGVVAAPSTGEAVFVVNTVADRVDAAPGDGVCATADGACSLRAAIEEGNRRPGRDHVHFDIGGTPAGGIRTITLQNQLPIINSLSGGLVIDGYTQPGAAENTHPYASNARLRVQIRGAAGLKKALVLITSPENTIRGLAIYQSFRPITLIGVDAHHNEIVGNWIGIDASAGNGVLSNTWGTNGTGGILLDAYAHDNRIGKPGDEHRNVVSGNPAHGIYLNHEFVENNLVQNNIVGLSPAGDRAIPNRIEGIDLNFGASHNLIGGTAPGERNVASGNGASGVELSHGWNYTRAPRADLSEMYNVRGNRVVGNYVGLLPDGTWAAYAENGTVAGVHVQDVSIDNLVEGNWIAGSRNGVRVSGDFTALNVVRDNVIGVTPAGAPAGSNGSGVLVDDSATGTVIAGNVIANFPVAGVRIANGGNDRNTISRNSIYANGVGILLGPGANDDRAAPAIARATTTAIVGTACAGCIVEVFVADGAAGAAGPGRTFVAAATAEGGTFSVPVSLAAGTMVTATATDGLGNTSTFTANVTVGTGPAEGAPIARDVFARQLAGGWGAAAVGGAWVLSGAAADWSTDGTGVVRLAAPGATRDAYLSGVVERDVDVTARVTTSKAAAGAPQYAWITVRRDATGHLRAELALSPDGSVGMILSRVSGTATTALTKQVVLPGVTYSPGTSLRLRVQAIGADPTTLRARAWADGTAEPDAWHVTATDSTPERQRAASVGLRAYIGGATTNAPVVVRWDDLLVTAPTP